MLHVSARTFCRLEALAFRSIFDFILSFWVVPFLVEICNTQLAKRPKRLRRRKVGQRKETGEGQGQAEKHLLRGSLLCLSRRFWPDPVIIRSFPRHSNSQTMHLNSNLAWVFWFLGFPETPISIINQHNIQSAQQNNTQYTVNYKRGLKRHWKMDPIEKCLMDSSATIAIDGLWIRFR